MHYRLSTLITSGMESAGRVRPFASGRSARSPDRVRRSVLALAMSLGLCMHSESSLAQTSPGAGLRPVGCESFGITESPPEVKCGYVDVPLRHDDPGRGTISLAAVVIPAQTSQPEPDPLFVAQGGPGGSTIETFAELLIHLPMYRPTVNRDLVLWDQRGTFHSKPALLCPEVAAADLEGVLADAPELSAVQQLEPYRVCGMRLAEEARDLSAFNTVENANDVALLARRLGYRSINFYGVSYGTELGQYLMRQHPEIVRSVILDAVVPTGFNLLTDVPFVQQRIGEKYFGGCAADPGCGGAYPDLATRFLAMLDRLDQDPVRLNVRNPAEPEGPAYVVELDGGLLGDALYQALYMQEMHPLIPYLVDRATIGDYQFIASVLLPSMLFDDTMSIGMYLTVVCAEYGDTDASMLSYTGLARRLEVSGKESAEAMLEICREWGIEHLDDAVHKAVVSDIPALLLSGDFDPITPPSFAAEVGAHLTNDYQVNFPSGSHGQAFGNSCADGLIQRFLDNPYTWPPGSCAQAQPDAYLLPHDMLIVPGLQGLVASPGEDGLSRVLRLSLPMLLGFALLATALPVYLIGGVVTRLRGKAVEHGIGAARTISVFAPWLICATAAVLAVFVYQFAQALAQSYQGEAALLYLGAISSEYRVIFWIATAAIGLLAGSVVTAMVLWACERRSPAGRVYFTILTLAAGAVVFSLSRLGMFVPPWGG